MTDNFSLWVTIIETMKNDNTYKLAWGKALIEILVENQDNSNIVIIGFREIAHKMLKYYWNQTFFFNLKQSPGKKPVVVKETEECIAKFIEIKNSNIPIWFDRAETVLKKENFYENAIKKIAKALTRDVSKRFLRSDSGELPLYELDNRNMTVTFTRSQVDDIKLHANVLAKLLNYKWAELLERFNHCPRILAKVKGISEANIRRGGLKKFKKVLINTLPNGFVRDFYTGDILPENDISVDHVIPWSFMYSDDIWNLVLTSRSNNSKKNNHIPSEEVIQRLKERNQQLIDSISNSKMKNELITANKEDYVSKFYIALKL